MKRTFSSTRTLVMLATLTAVGYGLSWLEFPVFPAAHFLKLDFSSFATLFGGYMFGPIGAIVIEGVKQLLIWGTKSTTAGVGEIANFVMNTAFAIVPSVLYLFKKGRPWVCAGMAAGCVLQIAAALLCNRFITFPLFMHDAAKSVFESLFWYVVAFNAIKSVSVSVLVFFLYKHLSFLIKRYVLTPRTVAATPDSSVAPTYADEEKSATGAHEKIGGEPENKENDEQSGR